MTVSKRLAHRIHSELQAAIGLIETENYHEAIKVLLKLAKLVDGRTVEDEEES